MALRELFVKIKLDSGNTHSELEKISSEVDRAKVEFEKFGNASSSSMKDMSKGFYELGRAALGNESSDELIRMAKAAGVSEKAVESLIKKTREDMKLDEQFREAARAAGLSNEEINKVKGSIDKAKESTASWKGVMTGLASVGLGALATGFAKSSLETFGKFEKYETVLKTTFTNSGEAAKAGMGVTEFAAMKASDAMEQIKTFAAATPFAVDELTGSFIKLANRGMTPTMNTMQAFGDVAASQGKSFDQFTEAVLDATSGEFERMKEFGIKAHKMGNQVELSFKGVNQKIANTPEAIQAAIIEFGKMEGVMGGMDAVSKTFTGKISNLGDSFDSIKNSVGKFLAVLVGPLLDFFTQGENASMRLNFALGALAVVIGIALVSATWAWAMSLDGVALSAVKAYAALLGPALILAAKLLVVYLILEDIWTFFEYGPSASNTYFADLMRWLGVTEGELQGMHEAFKEFKKVLGEMAEGFSKLMQNKWIKYTLLGIVGIIAAIVLFKILLVVAVVGAILYVVAKWDWLVQKFKDGWNWLINFLKKTAILTGKLIIATMFPLAGLYIFRSEIAAAFAYLWSLVSEFPFVQKLVSQFLTLKDKLSAVFSGMWESLKSIFVGLLPTETLNNLIDGINWISQKLNEFSSGTIATSLGITPLNLPPIPRMEARAEGGPVEAGHIYRVNERGEETFQPATNGYIQPHNKSQASSGGNTYQFSVSINSASESYDAYALYEKVMELINGENEKMKQRSELGVALG